MISFLQYCEIETCNKLNKNFYFPTSHLQFLTEDEKSLVYIEDLTGSAVGDKYVKFWYPSDEYQKQQERWQQYQKQKTIKPKESIVVSVCCGAQVHLFKNKKLNIETLVCMKCYKSCKTKIKSNVTSVMEQK